MTKLRYLIAGIIAFLIQGMALSYAPQEKVMSVSMEQGVNSMQIQLLARAASEAKPKQQIDAEKSKEPQPKTSEQQSIEVAEQSIETEKLSASKPLDPTPLAVEQPTIKKTAVEKAEPATKKQIRKPVVATKKAIEPKKIQRKPPPKVKATTEKKVPKVSKKTTETTKKAVEADNQTASQNSEPMLVSKPQFSARPVPVSYPKLARKKGLEGKTLIEVWLDSEGKQIKQKIIVSSGHPILDNRALNTIKQWQFSRRIVQGHAIAHRVQIPINFKLRQKER
ncbi:TonB family protein [Vibrio sinensis]|uniref:TonB family protein n=1 Tax=Vibrio sinensis TaxID=2302434 RepID=A0A3A6QN52_9VIBR|nr:energy transducer TonB [Vibrio sinensis]RJX70000.1 TonB family protein [Vibrio sinensis]